MTLPPFSYLVISLHHDGALATEGDLQSFFDATDAWADRRCHDYVAEAWVYRLDFATGTLTDVTADAERQLAQWESQRRWDVIDAWGAAV